MGRCRENPVPELFSEKNTSGRSYIKFVAWPVDIFDYIEVFYNCNRRHSHFGGVSMKAFG